MLKQIFLLVIFLEITFAQLTPLEESDYNKLTSYEELTEFITEIDKNYDFVNSEILTSTKENRNVYVLFFSKGEFGKDKNKLKILFFAQQHGNEQSSKEGALLLIKELTKPVNKKLFDKIDLAIVPQMNPDGSEKNHRRNANGVDLNRNHLILTENETKALHRLFDKYLFDVTLDIHEYSPYSNEWREFGFYKNADEQLGLLSNLDIDQRLKKFQKEKVLPYIKNHLNSKGFSFCEYVVGGPPNKERLRHSTIDINDGRQSFGILNTLSFILEGKNGSDFYVDNIKKRAKGQCEAMWALLKFCYENDREIKKLVKNARNKSYFQNETILRADHFPNGSIFKLPVISVGNSKDSILKITNYHPVVKEILKIKTPKGYLIPKGDTLLIEFLNNHKIKYYNTFTVKRKIFQYEITARDTILLEGEYLKNLSIIRRLINFNQEISNYIYVPLNQIKRNLIVLAFEPESMFGLIQYERYQYLIESDHYPILSIY